MSVTVCKAISTAVIMGAKPNMAMLQDAEGKPAKGLNDRGVFELHTLTGVVTGAKGKENKFGQVSNRYIGDFEATNLLTGEVFSSNNLYVASVLDAVLTNQLAKADGKGAQFGVVIGIKVNEKSPTGYEYVVQPIIAVKENDAMAELRKQMSAVTAGRKFSKKA